MRVVLRVIHPLSNTSTLEQRIIICADSVQINFENELMWDESRKILKVEFPMMIKSDFATYETQFGFIQRPTVFNNSWDIAKFEVCGHKFVDYSEYGYGVALLNDCKYGFSVKDNVMRMSIIRAPKSPDDKCDIGRHTFRYALLPHVGSFQDSKIVQAGYEFNIPLEPKLTSSSLPASSMINPSFQLNLPNVVLDTVKLAQDGSGNIILRMYEAYGGRGILKLSSKFTIRTANKSNILEDKLEPLEIEGNTVEIEIRPFQLITILLALR